MRIRRFSLPVWWWAAGAVLPLLVWWLGWHPGFVTSDTVDQWGQAQRGAFSNFHSPIHSMYLGVLSLGTSYPGLVTMFQILVFVGLLVYAAKRLVEAGVPGWLAVGAAWALSLSPAIGPTTIAFWKDVAFGLLMLWAWIELLAIANVPERANHWPTTVRLGVALAGVWSFRGNGPITVLLTLAVLFVVFRKNLKTVAVIAGSLGIVVLLVFGVLYNIVEVRGTGIEPAQVFLPDLAASFVESPDQFQSDEVDLLTDLAPAHIWQQRYDCFDSTPLLFDPEFDHGPIRESPGHYLGLQLEVLVRDFDTVAGHRICAANFLYQPAQPADAYFHRTPFEIPPNTYGLVRAPLSDTAYSVSLRIFQWAEVDGRLWLTWRPALVILPALVSILLFALPRGRRFLIPSTLFLAHVANVVITSPAQEFRFAYPLYVIGALTVTLVFPTLKKATQPEGT